MVALFRAPQSMHILHPLSFFSTITTGAANGLEVDLIIPWSKQS